MDPTLQRAARLVDAGEHGQAKPLLIGLLDGDGTLEDRGQRFLALRTLARCHRADREFGAARERALEALALARAIGSAPGEAIMLEGLALIESADGNLRAAGDAFWGSAEVERSLGRLDAMAAALANYAHMLIVHGLDGAERLLRRALDHATPRSRSYALAADNMASELERQGRHAEAVEWGARAVEAFRSLGDAFHLFIALRNQARHLVDARRPQEGAALFEEAYELILRLRLAEVNEAHYARYPERVAAIEARSETVVAEREAPDGFGVALMIGVHAHLGEELLKEGMRLLEQGRYAEAIDALERSREQWAMLDAEHCLVRVDYHLAYAYIEVGALGRALPLVFAVRARARALGDAYREQMALSLMIRLAPLVRSEDPLDHLAQERALRGPVARQLGLSPEAVERGVIDGGVMASLAAGLCVRAHAFELAERHLRSSLEISRLLPDDMRYRHAYRLRNLYQLETRMGRDEEAKQALAELRELAAASPSDPRIERVLAGAAAGRAFQDGDRSAATLRGLLAACRAYEALRSRAAGVELEGFAGAVDPPYEEAAEVALALERPALALALLQRGKGRTLLERLGVAPPPLPDDADADPPLPEVGDALGLELFAASSSVGAFSLDGASGELTWVQLGAPLAARPPDGAEGESLARALGAFADAADSERASGPVDTTLDALLAHPAFRALCLRLRAAAADGRATWLAPHRGLHHAPLHLLAADGEELGCDRWTLVPTLSAVAGLPPPRPRRGGRGATAFGDPLGDLPFARVEARLAAGADGRLAVGEACGPRLLEERCAAGDVGILHLACHGRFDAGHPERSGLLLAAPDADGFTGTQAAQLVTVADVARLPLKGAVVALSACSSGLAVVGEGDESTGLVSALLKAGAATVFAAQWPIPDLSAMLLMVELHDRLRALGGSGDLRQLLGEAREAVRTTSAAALATRGFELARRALALDAAPAEAVTVAGGCLWVAFAAIGDAHAAALAADLVAQVAQDPPADDAPLRALEELRLSDGRGDDVQPFAHPLHWGAFTIVGQGSL